MVRLDGPWDVPLHEGLHLRRRVGVVTRDELVATLLHHTTQEGHRRAVLLELHLQIERRSFRAWTQHGAWRGMKGRKVVGRQFKHCTTGRREEGI
jgi:hypothetical protein